MFDSIYSNRTASILASLPLFLLPMTLKGQTAQNAVSLKNWATPLYWQPNQAEREAATKSGAQIQLSFTATSNTALVFVAVSPCRLVDTRGASVGFIGAAPFSGPYIPAGGTVTFPVQSTIEAQTTAPSPCGTIPSIAQAYSLNLTIVPHPFGNSVNFVIMWPTGAAMPLVSTLNDQQGAVAANAAIVPAGPPPSGAISVYAYGATDVIIDMNGFFAAPTDLNGNTAIGAGTLLANTTGAGNTATGYGALQLNTTGNNNTADGSGVLVNNNTGSNNTGSGFQALQSNTTGIGNTAHGASALVSNTTGADNTATGYNALGNNIIGNFNTASGSGALAANTAGDSNTAVGLGTLTANVSGFNNTASGVQALWSNTIGNFNTASGSSALYGNTIGGNNIAVGNQAGYNLSTGSNNIDIGNQGIAGDNATIKIGTQGTQTASSIAGIYGGSPNVSNLPVCVDSTGILGTTGCGSTPSSQRFKERIADMGDSSNKLLQLRPVTFLYKPEYGDGSHSLQYGLIAEEVAKLYPDMVGYDKDGQPNSVKYQSLTPMLLNEVQKQNAQLQNQNVQLREAVQLQQEENRKLEDRLAALEALLSAQSPLNQIGAASLGGIQ